MSARKRLREADLCLCAHTYEDHVWGFHECEPCQKCECKGFVPTNTRRKCDIMGEPGAALTAPALVDPCMRGANMAKAICSIEGCGGPVSGRGWCSGHRMRWTKYGDPHIGGPILRWASQTERFWAKVNKTETCWLWTGALQHGYGAIFFDGKSRRVHRVAWLLTFGQWPINQLDHLCRVRHCVNPSHLEDVTGRENTLRGETIPAAHAAKTHCVNGHPFSGEHLGARSDGGRRCLTCQRESRRKYERRMAAGRADKAS